MANQKIVSSMWFDNSAEEAMNFYVDLFNNAPNSEKNSKITGIQYYPENAEDEHLKGMNGKVLNGQFELAGQKYLCLDGGPLFKFNEAFSLTVNCKDQEEVDYFWDNFTKETGGEESQCGWLKDKYGISWQIVPEDLGKYMSDPDTKKSGKAMEALMKMKKIDINEIEKAFNS